jgi:hypothetical protein
LCPAKTVTRALGALATEDSSALLVLVNFHRFLQSAEIVQALARQLASGKQNRTFVLVLSPIVQIPTELEKLFLVVEHPLPHRRQLEEIAQGVATDAGELPTGAELERLLDAAAGLTRQEAENAFSLSLVRHCQLQVETLWELKSQVLKKSGLLQLHRGSERFDDLGGLDSLKTFCKRVPLYAVNPFSRGVSKLAGAANLRGGGRFNCRRTGRRVRLFLARVVSAGLIAARIRIAQGAAQQHYQRSLAVGRMQVVAECAAKRPQSAGHA